MLGPLRFHPYMRPMPWGGRRLGDLLGKPLPSAGPCGESWEISDHPLHESVAADGSLAGTTLRQLMQRHPEALGGASARDRFPWLVKFLDASDWLSVQVHPDRDAVQRLLPGESSKTEAWFVLDAAPGSRIHAGLAAGVDEARLRRAVASGDSAAVVACLHGFEPQAGDFVFLPAGTVHAMGGGVLVAEIQETSDATFRLFDWGRCDADGKQRTLHIEEAMSAIHWDQQPVVKHVGSMEERPFAHLVRCDAFTLDHVRSGSPFAVGEANQLRVAVILSGFGKWAWEEMERKFSAGQAWLLPAEPVDIRCIPESPVQMLLCS